MVKLNSATAQSVNASPLGPGVLIRDLVEFTLQGVLDAINGDSSKGYFLGAMTAAPSIDIARDSIDLTENLVGINAPIKGASQTLRTDVTMSGELAEITHENLKLLYPGLVESAWNNGVQASLIVGTGNAAFKVTSKVAGTAGNSTNIVVSTPAGSSTSVSVATTTITVAPKTGETASGVAAAINANTAAAALVRAGLPQTSNGSGTVAAATSTPLAGGTAGTAIGKRFKPSGVVPISAYMDNVCLCLEGANTTLLQIYRLNNAIQTDDLSISPDDGGNISGVSFTFTGHVADQDRDPVTGVYSPPLEIFNLDAPVAA